MKRFITNGSVNGARVGSILRDSGCPFVIVAEEVLPDIDISNCEMKELECYIGRKDSFPVVRCYVKCPYFEGWVKAVRAPIKAYSLILGNEIGVEDSAFIDAGCPSVEPSAVSSPMPAAATASAAAVPVSSSLSVATPTSAVPDPTCVSAPTPAVATDTVSVHVSEGENSVGLPEIAPQIDDDISPVAIPLHTHSSESSVCAITRSSTKPKKVPKIPSVELTPAEFAEKQNSC